MKIRPAIISTLAVTALLAPTTAVANDVHVTIGLNHVTKDGVRKLKVAGDLHLLSGAPASCSDNRHVVIQRRRNSGADWKRVNHDMTNGNGHYSKVVGDKQGQFRVVAPSTGSCEKDKSAAKSHSH